eukprot:g159.t1
MIRSVIRQTANLMIKPLTISSRTAPPVPPRSLSQKIFAGRGLSELMKMRNEEEGRIPLKKGRVSPRLLVPDSIPRPPYADTGELPKLVTEFEIHDEEGIAKMRQSCKLAAEVLEFAASLVKPGVTTDYIDKKAHDMIIENGAYPSPLNYGKFPKSICTSVNECVCHGVPDSTVLRDGDVLNIDITVFLNGHHGDTSRMVLVGEVKDEAKKLIDANREAQLAAIALCAEGVRFHEIGTKIEEIANERGFQIVKEFVGHGVGKIFHAAPYVYHHRNREHGTMKLNQTFTIEPIFIQGNPKHRQWDDGWTEVAIDRSLSAQCEHTILITPDGHEILTLV